VWSGGSFVYVPKGVHVEMPLQAYFRLNSRIMGQFERTLIIVDEGAQVHYVEGCTAPTYSSDSFHSGVIEIMVRKGARCRYTTIQNWSTNVYNLVTQRAMVEEDGIMEWTDANLGSKLTMKYPSTYLMGRGARGEILSMAFAGARSASRHGRQGGCTSRHIRAARFTSKSISKDGGRASYRGLLKVYKGAERCVVARPVRCAAARRGQPHRHLSLHRDRRRPRDHRPTRRLSARSAMSSCSICKAAVSTKWMPVPWSCRASSSRW